MGGETPSLKYTHIPSTFLFWASQPPLLITFLSYSVVYQPHLLPVSPVCPCLAHCRLRGLPLTSQGFSCPDGHPGFQTFCLGSSDLSLHPQSLKVKDNLSSPVKSSTGLEVEEWRGRREKGGREGGFSPQLFPHRSPGGRVVGLAGLGLVYVTEWLSGRHTRGG